MNFITIKQSIIDILIAAEAGRYRTVGNQQQTKAAEEVRNTKRQVAVYYSRGDFSKSSGRPTGPVQHDITFRIELTVSKSANADLTVLNNPASTPAQIATALAAAQTAAEAADQSMDEFWSIIYLELMDGRNVDMQLPVGTISSRWIDSFQKDEPRPRGDLVVLTGIANLTLRTAEQIPGEIGTPGANIIEKTLDIKDNIPNIAGTLTDNS